MLRALTILLTCYSIATAASARNLEIFGGFGIDGVGSGTSGSGLVIGAIRSPGSDLEGQARLQSVIVSFTRQLEPGSIVIDTESRFLYLVLEGKKAVRYPVGVGREGKEWSGRDRITSKKQWPDWRPPPQMIKRERERGVLLPTFVKGGPKNPLGARALYIGSTEYRIHGTTQPSSIGRAVSSGCIRMHNRHVIDLYDRVKVGATVIVE